MISFFHYILNFSSFFVDDLDLQDALQPRKYHVFPDTARWYFVQYLPIPCYLKVLRVLS